MDEEAIRKEKQRFLRKEVINRGLDPNAFKDYLEEKKPGCSEDIDLWDIEDLKSVTYEFISMNTETTPKLQVEKVIEEPTAKPIKEKEEEKSSKEEEIPTKSYSMSKKVDFSYRPHKNSNSNIVPPGKSETFKKDEAEEKNEKAEVKRGESRSEKIKGLAIEKIEKPSEIPSEYECLTLERSQLEDLAETTEIIMKEFIVNEGGLLGKSYISYKVKTLPMNWEVQRRYSDFFGLRNYLKKVCPGIYVPAIPTKKAVGKMEPKTIVKRMNYLKVDFLSFQQFLNEILKIPILRNQKLVESFLSLTDNNLFNGAMKEADAIHRPTRLPNFKTLDGKVYLSNPKQDNKHLDYHTSYYTVVSDSYSTFHL